MRYSIPEENIEGLEKKLTRIRNKCARYGCEFKYERVGEHFEERTFVERDDEGRAIDRWTEVVRMIDVEVEGKAEVNGWRFAATLEYTDKGNLIHGVEGIEIPERYYSCSPWCEHCKTRRDRKSSYIVLNEETGEFKQVGRSCLRDFTGGLSAEDVALFESFFKEAEEASEFHGGGGFGASYFNVADFMAVAAETIRLYGYVKRDAYGMVSTGERAERLYRVLNGMRIPFREATMAMYDDAVAKGFDEKRAESVELAGKVRAWIAACERDDNYFHNLKVSCAVDYCGCNSLGLLVSAFPTYNRELEFEAERREREEKAKREAAESRWMGAVGDKVSMVIAEVFTISSWETQWGMTRVYKLTGEDGLVATWKTSAWLDDHDVGKVLKGTIKELKEFRGVKQSELTRCRLYEAPKKEEPHAPYNPETEKAFEELMEFFEKGA